MTAPSLIRKPDMLRAAEVAKETGCRVKIRLGEAVFIAYPDGGSQKEAGIDYSRPTL
ncbi:hypothetical protein [Pararhizobium gei]|uniref:hypothetical protein n=1 Tax=Pararhizobium gei TaxID=1395951 RepID=UPI0023DCCA7F|nr:hypothetical protein [Rhizobium gei]